MTTAASLMVRIGADVEDFTRGMTKAEKAANRGFSEIGEAAAKMAEVFSLEFIAAGTEFVHLAAGAQDVSARLDRVFGGAAASVKRELEEMTDVIPESIAAMQALAVKSDNMLQGLGYGADKAAKLSVEMVKLAGDMAAFAHVPIADAMDALDKGLAGKTRGLIQYGIVISQQAIHQEAMRRGLVDNHRTLTELGTAEIMESLIRERASRITGEAARTAGQASNSFKFLKVAAEEAGVSLGNIVLPAAVALTGGLRDMFDTIEHTSTGVKTFALGLGGALVGVNVVMFAVARLGTEMIALQRAAQLVAKGEGLAAALTGLGASTLPILTLAGSFAVLAAGVTAAYMATKNLLGEFGKSFTINVGDYALTWGGHDAQDAEDEAERIANDRTKSVIRKNDVKRNQVVAHAKNVAGAGGALSVDPRKPLDIDKDQAAFAKDVFSMSLQSGEGITKAVQMLNSVGVDATSKMMANLEAGTGAATRTSLAYQKIAHDMQEVVNQFNIGEKMKTGTLGPNDLNRASQFVKGDDELQDQVSGQAVAQETQLRLREIALAMVDTFNVVRVAAVELGERFRTTADAFGVALSQFKSQWGSGGGIKDSAMSGFQEAGAQILSSFTPASLAAMALGKVMQGLQPLIDAVLQPLVDLGHIIAIELTPVLRPLFQVLKVLGISVSLTAEIFYRAAAGIAHVIGSLISAIGSFISHIPFLGGLGDRIKGFGDGLLNLGASFTDTANQLKDARKQLIDSTMQTANAANALTASLQNVPSGFKIALRRFQATQAVGGSDSGPTPASSSSVSGSGASVSRSGSGGNLVIKIGARTLASILLDELRTAANAEFGDTTRWPELASL